MTSMQLVVQEEDENNIIAEREELMVQPSGEVTTLRKSHFLEPILNHTNQPLPKLCFSSLSLNLQMNELIKKRVLFRGRIRPLKGWEKWVEKMQKKHHATWKKAGIFDAIRGSTYKIKRHDELIFELAEKWCPESNTFIFPWGEATITLEDVMILGGFSVLGAFVQNPDHMTENEAMEKKLFDAFREIQRNCNCPYVSHCQWMGFFKGRLGKMENVALIALWLSRYVLLTNAYYTIMPNVFPIAISLARGTRVALAPAVLASIYRDLSLLREKMVTLSKEGRDDGLNLVLLAPFHLVQLWAWERFPISSPKPTSLAHGDPRLARWHEINRLKFGRPRLDMMITGDEFLWRPYARYLKNWECPKFYSDQGMWVLVTLSEVDEELLSFARCLMPCELVGVDCLAQYLPHRVAMQFGMDQGIPSFIPRSNDTYDHAWKSYNKSLDGLKFYLPPRLFEGGVTMQYANWWRGMLSPQSKSLITYEKRRRSKRLLNKMSQILHGSLSPPLVGSIREKATEESPFEGMLIQNHMLVVNEDELFSGVDPLMVIEDTLQCEHITEEGDKEKEVEGNAVTIDNGNKHSQKSSSPPLGGSSSDKATEESPFFEGMTPQNPLLAVNEDGPLNIVSLVMGMEDTQPCVHIAKRVVEENTMNIDNGSKHSKGNQSQTESSPADNETVGMRGLLMGPDMTKFCSAVAENEQGKYAEDKVMKQVKNSNDDIVIVDDDVDEENGDYDCFEALVSGMDARLTRLESVVSSLKAASLGKQGNSLHLP